MATISNTPRPGYVWDSADNVWYPIGVGAHQHTNAADTPAVMPYSTYAAAGKNKFLNANMAITQRGTAAVTIAGSGRLYSLDQNFGQINGDGIYTIEQVVDAPAAANAGQYSLKAVVTTADTSITADEQYFVGQIIEAQNFASFQFGTASAQTVTISFWVKSSITGTFGICIRNTNASRSYASTYTISVANTWEKKTVTIAGDTSGTWLKDTGIGARIEWILSAGSNLQTATPNVWTATNDQTTSSQTNWMATIGNSFQLTAIQIEAGSNATAFQTATGNPASELAACQRYYQILGGDNVFEYFGIGSNLSSTEANCVIPLKVTMRSAPTVTASGASNFRVVQGTSSNTGTVAVGDIMTKNTVAFQVQTTGLTSGNANRILANNTTAATIQFSAEL